MNKILAFIRKEQGQAMVEYAPILIIVSIAAVIALGAIGNKIYVYFNTVPPP